MPIINLASEDPPEKDMKDFEFIQLCKFQISQPTSEVSPNRSQLLASSSLYGLLFYVASSESFKVVKTSELVAIDQSKGKDRTKVTVSSFPLEASVILPNCSIEFLGVSSDDLTLAVVVKENNQPNILFFDVRHFTNKPTSVLPFGKSQFGGVPNMSIVDIGWNPTVGPMLAVCLSDGSLQLLDVTDQAKVSASLPNSIGATCFSWSPKGKQLLVGKKNGSLAQYDPSLTEKKQWQCPTVFNTPQTVIDVVWLSTYNFLAGYLPVGAQTSDQPNIVLTQSNKENNTKHINFEDPCFGNGEDLKPQFLFHFVQKWDMVILAASRASEVTVIGKNLDDKTSWEHWNLDDCSRAELPLASNQNDSFPLGMTVDYSPQSQVTLSEIKVLPPCPIMYVLTSDGLLLSYHLSYTHKEAAPVTIVPKALDPSAARRGVPGLVSQGTQQPVTSVPNSIVAATQPSVSPLAAFATPAAKPTFAFGGVATPKAGDLFPSGQKPPPAFSGSLFQTSSTASTAPSGAAPSFSFAMGPTSSAFVSLSPAAATTPQPTQQQGGAPPAIPFGASQSLLPKPNLQQQASLQPTSPAATSMPALAVGAGAQQPPATRLPYAGPAIPPTTAGIFGFRKKAEETPFGGLNSDQHNPNATKAMPQYKFSSSAQGQRLPAPASPAVTPSYPGQPGTGTLPTYGGQAGMGTPPTYAGQPGNGAPPTYAGQPGIGAPQTYAGQPGMVTPQTYAGQPGAPAGVSPSGVDSNSNSAIKATVDSAFIQNIAEEIADFEQEMKELKGRTRNGTKAVGNRTEMQTLRQDAEKMNAFLTEIKHATKEQTKESKELKSACYNLLYMAEECNTLHHRNNDPHYHSLLQGKALDPISAEKLKSLQQMAQSIESTVVDVDHVLDSHWNEHLNKEKERVITSAGDVIYKSIKNNHWLIGDQRSRLEKMEEQIRRLRLQPKSRKLETNGSHLNLSPQIRQVQDTSSSPSLKPSAPPTTMTPEKVSRLKEYLLHRKVPVVKPTTPADLSLSRIISQSARRAQSSAKSKVASQHHEQNHPTRPQHASTPQSRLLASQQIQQTPTGIPPAQLRLTKGNLAATNTSLPSLHNPAAPFSMGQQIAPQKVPTAFSGVAYFKQSPSQPQQQQQQHLPHQQQQQPPPPPLMMDQKILAAGQTIPPDVQAAAQVLSSHMGGALRQAGHFAQIPQLLSGGGGAGKSPLSQSQHQQPFYEDVTPTETDETNDDDDDDDDYDEEDNGYEDEDEYEEEEEEDAEPRPSFGLASTGKQGAGVDQGNGKIKHFLPSGGGEGQYDEKPSLFVPPKFGGTSTTSFNFGFNAGATSTASSSAGAEPSVFGEKASAGKSAFSFGGTPLFGQMAQTNPSGTSAASTYVFGSKSTPSKSTGFDDLSTGDNAKRDETKTAPSSATPVKAGTTGSPSNTETKLAKDMTSTVSKEDATLSPPASSAYSTTSAPSSSVTAFSFGGTSTDVAKSGAGGTSLFGSQTETSTTSPFASQQSSLPTGFSIFGGNKFTSPPGTKSGFEAVFSANAAASGAATSPSSDFSFLSNANPASVSTPSGGLFGATTTPVGESSALSSHGGGAGPGSGVKGSVESPISQVPSNSATTPATVTTSPAAHPDSTTAATPSSKEDTPNLFSSHGTSQTTQDNSAASTTTTTTTFNTTATIPAVTSGPSVSTPPTSQLFGGAPTQSAPTTGFSFGDNAATTSSIFGGKSAATSTAALSLFGNAGQASASTASVFGGVAASSSSSSSPSTTSSSLFGLPTATTTSVSSLFGVSASTTAATPTTAGASLFGMASATGSSTPLFGGNTPGEAAPSTTDSKSLFSSGGVVGTTTPASSAPSPFSGSSFASKSLFSTPSSSGTGGSSIFGGSTAGGEAGTTGSSLFGSTSVTTTASAVPAFGFGATTQASGSLFGGSSFTGDSGSGGNNLFSKPAASGGLFGNASSSGSLFGTASPSAANTNPTGSVFGQPPASAGFGQQAQSSSSSFFGGGGGDFGLGGKPSEERAKQNVFGSSSQTFGAADSTMQHNSLFGSGGNTTFGTVGSGSSFNNAAGGFSSNTTGGVSSTGFGVSAGPSSSGFGAAPAFGGTPSFGSPGFGSGFGGSKPAFGSSPSFGGTGGAGSGFGTSSTFGSGAAPPGQFGSSSGDNSGFGSFASTSAPSFGQLAQSPQGNAFGTNSTPQASVFGSGGVGGVGQSAAIGAGGGGGTGFGSFGASPGGFGQAAPAPAFTSAQSPGFGNSSFGSSPAFSSYRG